jgi:hypothetical protein
MSRSLDCFFFFFNCEIVLQRNNRKGGAAALQDGAQREVDAGEREWLPL